MSMLSTSYKSTSENPLILTLQVNNIIQMHAYSIGPAKMPSVPKWLNQNINQTYPRHLSSSPLYIGCSCNSRIRSRSSSFFQGGSVLSILTEGSDKAKTRIQPLTAILASLLLHPITTLTRTLCLLHRTNVWIDILNRTNVWIDSKIFEVW